MRRTELMPLTCLAKKDMQQIGTSFDYTKYYITRRKRIIEARKQAIENKDLNNNNKRHSLDSFMGNPKGKWLHPLRRLSAPETVLKPKNSKPYVPIIVLLYKHLQMLFLTAKEYSIIHKCLYNFIRTGSLVLNEEQIMENRKRLGFVLDEIMHISQRIEQLDFNEKFDEDRKITSIQHLKRNIRLHANMFIEDISLRVIEQANVEIANVYVEKKLKVEPYSVWKLCMPKKPNCNTTFF